MITRAYIHEYGNGRLEPEQQAVKDVLTARGIDCELFTIKRLHRNQLKLDRNTLVAADHPTMEKVFKRIGFVHGLNSYPTSLQAYLHRRVWETTIGKLMQASQQGDLSRMFVKPKQRAKLFTGFVVHSHYDLYQLGSFSKHTALQCSAVVEWQSEYRVFVNQSKTVGMEHYAGEAAIVPDQQIIERAVSDLEQSPERTNAYSLDFGVLSTGETALIEWNDGFALGAYDLDRETYTDLILSRWEEILTQAFVD